VGADLCLFRARLGVYRSDSGEEASMWKYASARGEDGSNVRAEGVCGGGVDGFVCWRGDGRLGKIGDVVEDIERNDER